MKSEMEIQRKKLNQYSLVAKTIDKMKNKVICQRRSQVVQHPYLDKTYLKIIS